MRGSEKEMGQKEGGETGLEKRNQIGRAVKRKRPEREGRDGGLM